MNQLIKNHALVPDRDLAYEILLAKLKDRSYGPLAEAIKHSIGNVRVGNIQGTWSPSKHEIYFLCNLIIINQTM